MQEAPVASQDKICTRCRLAKPSDEFRIERDRRNGRMIQVTRCRDCTREYFTNYYRNRTNHRQRKSRHFFRKYGITEGYEAILESQGGVCAICGGQEIIVDSKTGELRLMAVDHCHVTEKVRGILCSQCNHGLGKFRDDPFRLQAAISYLNKHSGI